MSNLHFYHLHAVPDNSIIFPWASPHKHLNLIAVCWKMGVSVCCVQDNQWVADEWWVLWRERPLICPDPFWWKGQGPVHVTVWSSPPAPIHALLVSWLQGHEELWWTEPNIMEAIFDSATLLLPLGKCGCMAGRQRLPFQKECYFVHEHLTFEIFDLCSALWGCFTEQG